MASSYIPRIFGAVILMTSLANSLMASSRPAQQDYIQKIIFKNQKWNRCLEYGDVSKVKYSFCKDAMIFQYGFNRNGINHIAFLTDMKLNMNLIESIGFDAQFVGQPVDIYLFLYDDKGSHVAYGPLKSESGKLTHFDITSTSKIGDGGSDIDLSKIVRIGFMLNSPLTVKRLGTLCLKNFCINYARDGMKVSGDEISPNGDGIFDKVNVKCYLSDVELPAEVILCDSSGNEICVMKTIVNCPEKYVNFDWPENGRLDRKVPENCTVMLKVGKDYSQTVAQAPLKINRLKPWPLVERYRQSPFASIGVFFEGDPVYAEYDPTPENARIYYDKCFADIARMGMNTVFISNSPEELWGTILDCAEKHKLKIILYLRPAQSLIWTKGPVRESEVDSEVKRLTDMLKKYPALLRYGIYDEPPIHLLEKWNLVKRAFYKYDKMHPISTIFCTLDSCKVAYTKYSPTSEVLFDYYPITEDMPKGYNSLEFIDKLEAYEKLSDNLPRWAVIQAFIKPQRWRFPTDAELRSMTYGTLYNGVHGVCFFLYQGTKSDEKLRGMTKIGGGQEKIYGTVEKLAGELKTLLPLIAQAKTKKPVATSSVLVKAALFSGQQDVLVLVNTDTKKESPCTLSIGGTWCDALSGETYNGNNLSVKLAPGDGKVLIRQ